MTDIIYTYENQVYINITNRCNCRCEFCIRSHQDSVGSSDNLWFEKEPSLEEIKNAINNFFITKTPLHILLIAFCDKCFVIWYEPIIL